MPINLGEEARKSRGHQGGSGGKGEGECGLGQDIWGPRTWALCHWKRLERDPVQLDMALVGPPGSRAIWELSLVAASLLTWLLSHPPEMDQIRLHMERALAVVGIIEECSKFLLPIFLSA